MLAYRLTHLTEAQADALANSLVDRVQRFSSTRSYHKLCRRGLRQRLHEICAHLDEWLLRKGDTSLERRYREIGARRYRQQVPLAELIRAIVFTKETLRLVRWQTVPDRSAEAFGETELVNLVEQFFDSAIYFVPARYDDARVQNRRQPAAVNLGPQGSER